MSRAYSTWESVMGNTKDSSSVPPPDDAQAGLVRPDKELELNERLGSSPETGIVILAKTSRLLYTIVFGRSSTS